MRCYVNMRVLLDYASPPPPPIVFFSCCYGFFKVTTTSHDSRVKTPPGMPLDRIQIKKKRKATLGRSRCIQLIVINVINIITVVMIIFSPSSPPPWWLFSGRDRSSLVALPASCQRLSVSSSVFAFSTSLRSYVVTTPHWPPPTHHQ